VIASEQFQQAIAGAGLPVPEVIHGDGNLYRYDPGTARAPSPDTDAILAALHTLFTADDVIELRAFPKGRKRTDAGYFDGQHWPQLAEHAARLSASGAAVYVTLNPVDPQLLSRYSNRIEGFAQATTTDKQVTRRRWLLVDIDPVRPSGTSATDAQLAAAKAKARQVYGYLNGLGWPAPLVAESGNGMHLLYGVDLPNDDEATALVKAVLIALGERFDDAQTKVDRAVFNAARICKLYGTLANKGDDTPMAPWRLSKLLQSPARAVVTPEQLQSLIPAATPVTTAAPPMRQSDGFNLEDFLTRHGLAYTADRHDGSERFKLAACPFNAEHGNGEAAIFRKASGALGFKCQHDSCSAKAWRDVRDLLDGPRPTRPQGEDTARHGETFPPLEDPDDSGAWPDPQPLIAQLDPEDYPLDALPAIIRHAVMEVSGFVKAPVPLIATSALAALSLAIQAHVDVERAEKLDGPTGLFLLAVADSGERKSTCDGFFTRAIRDYEAAQQEAAKPLIQDFKSAHDAWEAQRSGLKEKIKSLSKEGKSCASQVQELHNLDADEPKPPRVPRLIYGDATPEALAYSLAHCWPSGGVVSSEAGSVFGSHGMGKESAMRNLAMLNQLWDGASLPVERRSTESFTVRGARLTMALQVQESTLRAFFDSTKGLARGTGFLARFLVSWPRSTQGTRNFTDAPVQWPSLAAFNDRLSAILNQPVPISEDGALTPAMLTLSDDAKAAWVTFHDAIEAELSTGGELHEVRDVASKTADNAARLAALLHTFTGSIGPIGLEAMESASRIAVWHLLEARRFLGELALPAELANPARLESWLLDYCRRESTDTVSTREIQRCGPHGLRDKAVIDSAIKELSELGRAKLVQDGKKKAVQINPALMAEVTA
jgi:hypothetical protein